MKLFAAVLALSLSSVNAFTVSPMHVTARAPMAAERPAFAARDGESALKAMAVAQKGSCESELFAEPSSIPLTL